MFPCRRLLPGAVSDMRNAKKRTNPPASIIHGITAGREETRDFFSPFARFLVRKTAVREGRERMPAAHRGGGDCRLVPDRWKEYNARDPPPGWPRCTGRYRTPCPG